MCNVTDLTVCANVSNCVDEVYRTTYNTVAKMQTLLEGSWIYCFSQGLKYFDFTEQQAKVYDAVGEQFYSKIIEAILNDDETGEKLYAVVQDFVHLFLYFIHDENVISKTA
ncbi:hypothetical protein [Priestia megaterium]|uniref:hypothetical protein n=1 Tax=Priestia megaterium TaxID=1404 RepID=UPI001FB54FCD|nr:hypothetical protein [Priestia megaterium]